MSEALVRDAATAAGADAVRLARGVNDLIDGVLPTIVVSPTSAQHVAATLAWASAAGHRVVVRGAGTKDAWGRTPDRVDVLLNLARLNRVLAHEASDLTATLEAGARLSDVNQRLMQHGQWLPLDPPHAVHATIGGILATNDVGPSRHRHGTPRDMVIGMTIATADGVLSSSGGRVVKNVAGYDVARLMTGSHGSLAAIVSATFKLAPVAPCSQTLVATLRDPSEVAAVVDGFREQQCEPDALDFRVTRDANAAVDASISLLVRCSSVRAAVNDGIAVARACIGERTAATGVSVFENESEKQAWSDHDAASWSDADAVIRVSWRPATFAEAAACLGVAASPLRMTWTGRAAIGSGLIGVRGGHRDIAALVDALRGSALFNHVVVIAGSSALRASVGVWHIGETQQSIWRALKQACDPGNTLNADRGPL